ncbi:class I adenylate-forming enzyme family protein [uncultured Sneathiella sp.]|uniref:class I adenylate-forming enzyme family protein n=1 Tax=uncultured Sneathiella sp. TaxID=879315 RepID=UPI0030EF5B5A|tara:strand:- start:38611 stop:40215 length:1605 start_codon:yes stop_codon:yes gene_type:complete
MMHDKNGLEKFWGGYTSLATMVRGQAEKTPNQLALVARSANGHEERLTYSQLVWQGEKFARALMEIGAKQGDHIGVLLDNKSAYEAIMTLLACAFGGMVCVPVNARFAQEEILHAVTLADTRILICGEATLPRVRDIRSDASILENVVLVGDEVTEDTLSWRKLFNEAKVVDVDWPERGLDDISEILFTSGTTSRPKAALMSNRSVVASAYGFSQAMSLEPGTVYQSFFPFFTTASIRCLLYPSWFVGATAVVDPELDVMDILARMERERTTTYIGVPAFYIFLLEKYQETSFDLSSLEIIDAGGAAMPAELTRRLIATFPKLDVRQTYGQTEGGPCGTVLIGSEALAHIGSAGTPWPQTELRIVDENGNDVGPNIVGEIVVRSPSVFSGYFKNEEATRETLKDGWLFSGDLGQLDGEGYLFVVDRKKDMVIRGGLNIGTQEVESVLHRYDGVEEAAVIGVPHDKLGEDLLAVLTVAPGVTIDPEAIRQFCADKLADFKIPRRYEVIAEMPRSPMGKILKTDLREKYSKALVDA